MTAAALPLPGRRPVLADVLPGARSRDVALIGGPPLLTALLGEGRSGRRCAVRPVAERRSALIGALIVEGRARGQQRGVNTAQQAGSSETARNLLAVVYTSLAITAFSIVGLAGGSGGSGGGSAEEQGSSTAGTT